MLTSFLFSIDPYLSQIAELVATEFFEQGDKEREELNIEPIVSLLLAHYITLCEHKGHFNSGVRFQFFNECCCPIIGSDEQREA